MHSSDEWQRIVLLVVIVMVIGSTACTAGTAQPGALPEDVQPSVVETFAVERAPGSDSENSAGSGEFTGTLQTIDGDQWTIAGQTFVVTQCHSPKCRRSQNVQFSSFWAHEGGPRI